jgi:hypothetical protein
MQLACVVKLVKDLFNQSGGWAKAGHPAMVEAFEKAQGKPLSPEQSARVADLHKEVEAAHKTYEAADAALRSANERGDGPATQAWDAAEAAFQRSNQSVNQEIGAAAWKTMSAWERAKQRVQDYRVGWLISGPISGLKVLASGITQPAAFSLYSAVGKIAKQLPGLAEVAPKAGTEGGHASWLEAEKAGWGSTGQGIKDARDIIMTGYSDLDARFGHHRQGDAVDKPTAGIEYLGRLHAAEKAIAVRNLFERNKVELLAQYEQQGKDVTSPEAKKEIRQKAYDESLRAKFQEDNFAVNAWNAVDKMAQSSSGAAQAGMAAANFLVPIRRTPTNIVLSALEHLIGVPLSAARTAQAKMSAQGIAGLTEAQANGIMRQFKRGTVGVPLLMLGYYLGDKLVGGLYSGRRKDQELKPGEIDTPLGVVPAWVTAHHPAFMALHLGAAAKREEKRRGGSYGHALEALMDEVPFIREGKELPLLLSGDRHVLGNFARGIAVPGLVNFIARQTDTAPHRYPRNVAQEVEMGIPGLRQNVPTVPAPRR